MLRRANYYNLFRDQGRKECAQESVGRGWSLFSLFYYLSVLVFKGLKHDALKKRLKNWIAILVFPFTLLFSSFSNVEAMPQSPSVAKVDKSHFRFTDPFMPRIFIQAPMKTCNETNFCVLKLHPLCTETTKQHKLADWAKLQSTKF